MRRLFSAALGACALAAASAAPAHAAAAIPAGGLTIEELAAALKASDLPVTVKKTDSGEAYVESTSDGTKFQIWLYDCKKARCASIQFEASFDLKDGLGVDKVNEWNRKKRYVRLWLDDEKDPIFQYDVNVAPGGTYEALKDEFGTWKIFLPEFRSFIGW
jgi:hypothetical protein